MPETATTEPPKKRKRNGKKGLKFEKRLVLNQWILSLFEVATFDELAKDLKDPRLEAYDENNVSQFYHQLTHRLFGLGELNNQILLAYDENIAKHTQRLNEKRKEPIRWKYFQYLCLLFTEIYLDRFFSDPSKLLADLNRHVAQYNEDKEEGDRVSPYQPEDLHKLAFWSATGSGKTLVMHVNILEYRFYLTKHGRQKELNRIILLTPNEGLSRQHLEEFQKIGMDAELFDKDSGSLFAGQTIEIIDIHKLGEEAGEKVVAVDSFEGNNLVLVDEGHRGASTDIWKGRRDQLCEKGFSFEYSATFGQTIAAANKKALTDEYAKCILFDFSYRYFYKDGYGKYYRILNLAEDHGNEARLQYLTAGLMVFYQQLRLYEERKSEYAQFLIERPLWVFVGGSVTKEVSTKEVSDVVDILKYLANFLGKQTDHIKRIDLLLKGTHGLTNTKKEKLFSNTFTALIASGLTAEAVYSDILKRVFNAGAPGKLHVDQLKNTDGEVALSCGENEAFGVINVGDPSKLCKKCEEHEELVVGQTEYAESLFQGLNKPESHVQMLIGSKKFSEGWSSWRVSTMGLMNVGKSEGAQIIQLFGRGVRLKGHNFGLKRSDFVDGVTKPKYLREVETLNVLGVQAHYMEEFKKFLEEEGLPAEEDWMEFILPTCRLYDDAQIRKLKTVQLPENLDFKKDAPKPRLDTPSAKIPGRKIVLDWYPKIQSRMALAEGTPAAEEAIKHEGQLTKKHLAFFNWTEVYREMQDFKNERSWYNLDLPRESVSALLTSNAWYTLYIPPEQLQPDGFDRIRVWQDIAVALLKKYADAYYKAMKSQWEAPQLIYTELDPNDSNFVSEYRFLLDQSQEEIRLRLNEIKESIAKKELKDFDFGVLRTISFRGHLYQPLIYLNSEYIQVTPVHLNEGERDFVLDLRTYYDKAPAFFKGKEMYLLRNRSRGRGIGFFEAGNFYPDFILWLVVGPKQYVSFVDPKGIRNLDAGIQNPKIQFYKAVKEIEKPGLDPNIVLNSFIVTTTKYTDPGWWTGQMTKEQFESCHVFFQQDDKDTYMSKILTAVLAPTAAR